MKIRLIVFDLDGVLVDSRPLHYHALNEALAEIDPIYVNILQNMIDYLTDY